MSTIARRVSLLGSTGSIGTQALQVIAEHPGRFEVVALAAGSDTETLAAQVQTTGARIVGIADDGGSPANPERPPLAEALGAAGVTHPVEILTGPAAAEQIAGESGADTVLNGMTGSIGLRPTLAALASGALLALANKESLVVGGRLVAKALRRPGQIVPVDSEHSALAQALSSGRHERGLCSPGAALPRAEEDGTAGPGASEVSRLIITASGGPFRGWPAESLAAVTPAQALKHPTWTMGRVVTTNSATMVNKALEIIEAHLLFDVPLDDIDAVVHPQSVVHSMVQYVDGSIIAQASPPDMRLPIALGLDFPHRVPGAASACDFTQAASWDFEPLDHDAFPAVRLAKQACGASATHMAVYNAANEQAVDAFHENRLSFPGILETVEEVLSRHTGHSAEALTLEDVLDAEAWARAEADVLIAASAPTGEAVR